MLVLVYVVEEEVEAEHVITTGKGKEEKLFDIWGLVVVELDVKGKGVVAHALGFFSIKPEISFSFALPNCQCPTSAGCDCGMCWHFQTENVRAWVRQ